MICFHYNGAHRECKGKVTLLFRFLLIATKPPCADPSAQGGF